jgi:hypothetical protein
LWNKTTISAERQSTPNDSRVFETGNLPRMLPSAQDSSHMLPAAKLVPANKKPSEPAARLDESDRVRWENVISSVSTRTPLRPFQGKHAPLPDTTSMMSCVYSSMRMGRRSYKGRLADFSSADFPIPFFAAGWDSFFRLLVRTLGAESSACVASIPSSHDHRRCPPTFRETSRAAATTLNNRYLLRASVSTCWSTCREPLDQTLLWQPSIHLSLICQPSGPIRQSLPFNASFFRPRCFT